jgi:hypothetical protein
VEHGAGFAFIWQADTGGSGSGFSLSVYAGWSTRVSPSGFFVMEEAVSTADIAFAGCSTALKKIFFRQLFKPSPMACSSGYHQLLRLSRTLHCIDHAKMKDKRYRDTGVREKRYDTDGCDDWSGRYGN